MAASLRRARFEQMEDGSYFPSIPRVRWTLGGRRTKAEAEQELHDALDGWVDLAVKDRVRSSASDR
jgi:predicted RNase H-like HicB family nuclease